MPTTHRIDIPPVWRVVPPETDARPASATSSGEPRVISLALRPGPGFGSGTHETTQLCLQAIHALHPRGKAEWSLLDFGSGSGILSIGGAKLGARVEGVEIREEAILHAEDNARLNDVADRVHFSRTLDEAQGPFDLVVANILLAVLLEFAEPLVRRIAPAGALVLSGLFSTDVPGAIARYAECLAGQRPDVYARGEWRALAWTEARPGAPR